MAPPDSVHSILPTYYGLFMKETTDIHQPRPWHVQSAWSNYVDEPMRLACLGNVRSDPCMLMQCRSGDAQMSASGKHIPFPLNSSRWSSYLGNFVSCWKAGERISFCSSSLWRDGTDSKRHSARNRKCHNSRFIGFARFEVSQIRNCKSALHKGEEMNSDHGGELIGFSELPL